MCRVTAFVSYIRILTILFITTRLVHAIAQDVEGVIIGYDCDGNKIPNVTTISWLDIDDSDLELELVKLSQQPDRLALRLMEGPGYMAVLAGEVIHIVQCVPVEVKFNHVDKCYNRLPVLRGNDSMFLMPMTHIISTYATEVSCDSPLLEHYNIQGTWYTFIPSPVPAITPVDRKSKITWKKEIFLDSMSKRIMFPIDQTVVQESLAKQFTNNMREPVSISNVFDEDMKQQIAESILSKTWGRFMGFGTTCAGLIGVYVCFSFVKSVADAVINGSALYKVFGWSFILIGACWDTVAYILLARGNKKSKKMETNLSTLNADDILEVEEETTDFETGVHYDTFNACVSPIPTPRRFRE